ncbi:MULTISPECIES: hypothetical protein [unclassified Streptomyces]|uniref:hypothetical protein n=1 Tax=unclassified Streptomyces TaxID=2593676 RepID=UPI0040437454
MPRRRPGSLRGPAPSARTRGSTHIDGLPSRVLIEIARLERTRSYLRPGDVGAALRHWREYVHLPQRRLWQDYEWGNPYWYCCEADPFEARALLDTVMGAHSARRARELRRIVSRFDAVWNRPSPPYDPGGG